VPSCLSLPLRFLQIPVLQNDLKKSFLPKLLLFGQVGWLSVSLAALLVSLFLFVYFKSLSCRRIPLQKKLFAKVVAFWPGCQAFCVPGLLACLSVPLRLLQVPVLQTDPSSPMLLLLGRLAGFQCPWPPCLSPSFPKSTTVFVPQTDPTSTKAFCQSCCFLARLAGFLCPWPPCLPLQVTSSPCPAAGSPFRK
jgi:hypothetical protein